MWESLARVNAVVGGVVWGSVGLALLFGTGCLLTVRTGFFPAAVFRVLDAAHHRGHLPGPECDCPHGR